MLSRSLNVQPLLGGLGLLLLRRDQRPSVHFHSTFLCACLGVDDLQLSRRLETPLPRKLLGDSGFTEHLFVFVCTCRSELAPQASGRTRSGWRMADAERLEVPVPLELLGDREVLCACYDPAPVHPVQE